MTDSVNDYGMGAPGSQPDELPTHDPQGNPLSTGLGAPDDVVQPQPDEAPTEHGLGAASSQGHDPVPEEPQPPQHGLGD